MSTPDTATETETTELTPREAALSEFLQTLQGMVVEIRKERRLLSRDLADLENARRSIANSVATLRGQR